MNCTSVNRLCLTFSPGTTTQKKPSQNTISQHPKQTTGTTAGASYSIANLLLIPLVLMKLFPLLWVLVYASSTHLAKAESSVHHRVLQGGRLPRPSRAPSYTPTPSLHPSTSVRPSSLPSSGPTFSPTRSWTDSPRILNPEWVIAHYPFDGSPKDASGHHPDCVSQGNVQLTEDRYGLANSAYSFNGGHLNCGPSIGHAKTIKTMALWAKFASLDGGELLSKSTNHIGTEVLLFNNQLRFYAMGGLSDKFIGYPVENLSLQQWYFIVATQEGEGQKPMTLYVDGRKVAEGLTPTTLYDADNLMIGNWNGLGRPFFGVIDDVTLFNVPLSEAQIQQLYRYEALSSSPSLEPTWRPTYPPSAKPSSKPTFFPSLSPSFSPTSKPSLHPSTSVRPSSLPSSGPTFSPTRSWTDNPRILNPEWVIAHYPFDGSPKDVSGHHPDCVLQGNVQLTEDRYGLANSAYRFNGGHLNCGPSIGHAKTIKTMALWAKFASLDGGELVSKSTNHIGTEVLLFNKHLTFAAMGGNVDKSIGYPVENLSLQQWYFIVATQEGEGQKPMTLYVDGRKVAEGLTPTTLYDADNLMIGNWNGLGRPFFGVIDDVTLFKVPLSEAQIQQLYRYEALSSSPSVLPSHSPSVEPTQLFKKPSEIWSDLELICLTAGSSIGILLTGWVVFKWCLITSKKPVHPNSVTGYDLEHQGSLIHILEKAPQMRTEEDKQMLLNYLPTCDQPFKSALLNAIASKRLGTDRDFLIHLIEALPSFNPLEQSWLVSCVNNHCFGTDKEVIGAFIRYIPKLTDRSAQQLLVQLLRTSWIANSQDYLDACETAIQKNKWLRENLLSVCIPDIMQSPNLPSSYLADRLMAPHHKFELNITPDTMHSTARLALGSRIWRLEDFQENIHLENEAHITSVVDSLGYLLEDGVQFTVAWVNNLLIVYLLDANNLYDSVAQFNGWLSGEYSFLYTTNINNIKILDFNKVFCANNPQAFPQKIEGSELSPTHPLVFKLPTYLQKGVPATDWKRYRHGALLKFIVEDLTRPIRDLANASTATEEIRKATNDLISIMCSYIQRRSEVVGLGSPSESKAIKDHIDVTMMTEGIAPYQAIFDQKWTQLPLELQKKLTYCLGQFAKAGVLGYHQGNDNRANTVFYQLCHHGVKRLKREHPELPITDTFLNRFERCECIMVLSLCFKDLFPDVQDSFLEVSR